MPLTQLLVVLHTHTSEGVNSRMQSEMTEFLSSFNSQITGSSPITERVTITPIRDLYAHFEYRDLCAHPAIVILPYQVLHCCSYVQ